MKNTDMMAMLLAQAWIMIYVVSESLLALFMAIAWCLVSLTTSIVGIIKSQRELKFLKKEINKSMDRMIADLEKMVCEEDKKPKKRKKK